MTRIRLALSAVLVLAAATAAYGVASWSGLMAGHADAPRVSAGDLENLPVLMPDGDPQGMVVLVSGAGGAGKSEKALTARLLAGDLIVLPVDLDSWRRKLDSRDGECLYLGSELEDIAKESLRTVGLDTYFHPVVAGVGEGGTLAWAALADAPVATLAGAVALDPTPALITAKPTCPGAAAIAKAGKGFSYAFDAPVPGRAMLISAVPLPDIAGDREATVPIDASDAHRPKTTVEADPENRLDAAVTAILRIAKADASAQDLPVIDIPAATAAGPAQSVAVFFSGDGGWRDLDKSMGDWLAGQGVHVVGVDSLRYFWSERTPDEIAADTETIIEEADPSGTLPVAILAYSFGADTFPFAWDKLPQALRDRIRLVGLLGTEKTTRFQVSVGEWLGIGGDQLVAPAIATIPKERVVCVHGEDEDDTACTDPLLKGIEVLSTDGGHHFDGDYDALAAKLLAAFKTRLASG